MVAKPWARSVTLFGLILFSDLRELANCMETRFRHGTARARSVAAAAIVYGLFESRSGYKKCGGECGGQSRETAKLERRDTHSARKLVVSASANPLPHFANA